MQSLRKLEARFLEALLDDTTTFADAVPSQRMDVYRNNFLEGHRKALAATYPVVAALVGEACFRTLAYDYARGFPSRAGDLAQFGCEFSFFLRAHYATTEHAYLIDVARLERAYIDALNAADASPLDLQQLAGALDGRELTFTFQPSVRFVRSRFPIFAIWQAHQSDRDFQIDLSSGEERLLIHRPTLDVEVLSLDVAQYEFLQALDLRQPLTAALDHALSVERNFDLTATLALLITHGVLNACASNSSATEHIASEGASS
jgi:hypothetical protein